MSRWVYRVLIGLPLAGLTVVLAGYLVIWPMIRGGISGSVEDAIAQVIETQVTQAIEEQGANAGMIRLTAIDLDINTFDYFAGDTESGFEIINGDASIYGAVTTIGSGRLQVAMADLVFTAQPDVDGGRVDLTEITYDKGIIGRLITSRSFERGLENGINSALAASGLTPVDVRLNAGMLMITIG